MSKQLLFRLAIDFIMTALMLTAFAYQLTGNLAHEVIGVAIFLLFIAHNALNRRWYKNLFTGKYSLRRTLGTIVNFLLAAVMILLAISSIMISRDVFAFWDLGGGFEARQLHTLSSYWGLVLVSVHLGLHWSMILGAIRKMTGITGTNRIRAAALCLLSIVFAAYGVKSSFDMDIGSKLFLRYTFGYWDFENAAAVFFLAYLSIMWLYVIITHCMLVLLEKIAQYKRR